MKRTGSDLEIVGIANLKAKLAHYLRKVQVGEEIIVTNHRRPVAKIVSLAPKGGLEVLRAKGSFAEVATKKFDSFTDQKVDSLSHLLRERGNR